MVASRVTAANSTELENMLYARKEAGAGECDFFALYIVKDLASMIVKPIAKLTADSNNSWNFSAFLFVLFVY